jgi:tRNA wybutosine-synthesizing protein 3
LTASTANAQLALTAALSAGFRESGAVSLGAAKNGETTPMVAVRSTGYSFDSIIGYQNNDGDNIPLVDERYLQTLVAIANDRFRINTERIARFRKALMDAFSPSAVGEGSKNPDWEDAEVRKQRKRDEGLARQRALQLEQSRSGGNAQAEQPDDDSVGDVFH